MSAITTYTEKLLTCREAALLRGVSDRTVRWWIKRGLLPVIRENPYLLHPNDVMAVEPSEAGNPNLKKYGRMTEPHRIAERVRLARARKRRMAT